MSFSFTLLKYFLFPVMWKDALESIYHTLLSVELAIQAINEKSFSNWEENAPTSAEATT